MDIKRILKEQCMLGYAIRIIDERRDSFYKSPANLMNKFLVGEMLSSARFFSERESAENKLVLLEKYLNTPLGDRTIHDHILEANSKFNGFEIVEVEFDELYFILTLNIEDKIGYVRSVLFDQENGHPFVCISQVKDDAERHSSSRDAQGILKTLKAQNFIFHEHLSVEDVFVNPKLFV